MRWIPLIALLLNGFPGAARASPEALGAWSKPVDGMQGRLILKKDQPMGDVRMIAVDLELRNVSDDFEPIEIYYNSLNLAGTVRNHRGKVFDGVPLFLGMVVPPPYWLAIPREGSVRFHVASFGYEIPKVGGPQGMVPDGPWVLESDGTGPYFLSGSFQSQARRPGPPGPGEPQPGDETNNSIQVQNQWRGTLDLAPVRIPLRTVAATGTMG